MGLGLRHISFVSHKMSLAPETLMLTYEIYSGGHRREIRITKDLRIVVGQVVVIEDVMRGREFAFSCHVRVPQMYFSKVVRS